MLLGTGVKYSASNQSVDYYKGGGRGKGRISSGDVYLKDHDLIIRNKNYFTYENMEIQKGRKSVIDCIYQSILTKRNPYMFTAVDRPEMCL